MKLILLLILEILASRPERHRQSQAIIVHGRHSGHCWRGSRTNDKENSNGQQLGLAKSVDEPAPHSLKKGKGEKVSYKAQWPKNYNTLEIEFFIIF